MTTNFKLLAEQYKHELLDKVVPFWLDKSQDTQHGGYFTCLERDGSVFDTDKFVWLQGREVWMFATLYNKVEKRQEWLDCAIQGAEFLKKHGHDGHLNWYFALDREGHPLVEPYNIFSYTFAVIAFGQLHRCVDAFLNIIYNTTQIAVGHIGRNHNFTFYILAVDRIRSHG